MNARAFYNENDPFAAAWLRELIREGLIAPGDVDERSIVDLKPADLDGFTQCHFFAGIGGWSLALRIAGWPDDRSVWTGSCPCQPFSAAGKRQGYADERHLWPAWARLIRERSPSIVFGEQVASAAQWLRLVRGDLEALGYAVGAIPIEAASAGADHLRDRFWFVADATREQVGSAGQPRQREHVEDDQGERRREGRTEPARQQGRLGPSGASSPIDVVDALGERGCGRHVERQDAIYAVSPSASGDLADTGSAGAGRYAGNAQRAETSGDSARSQHRSELGGQSEPRGPDAYEWVVGADGKARRTLAGVCLLVNGFPARVGLLRGFGNAIDPRPAAQFIAAAEEAMRDAA